LGWLLRLRFAPRRMTRTLSSCAQSQDPGTTRRRIRGGIRDCAQHDSRGRQEASTGFLTVAAAAHSPTSYRKHIGMASDSIEIMSGGVMTAATMNAMMMK
jgi:hypothetical protein